MRFDLELALALIVVGHLCDLGMVKTILGASIHTPPPCTTHRQFVSHEMNPLKLYKLMHLQHGYLFY